MKVATASQKCSLCSGDHYLSQCQKFPEKLCSNCLRPFHVAVDYNSSKCNEYSKAHHSLLHHDIFSTSEGKTTEESSTSAAKESLTIVSQRTTVVLLPNVVVNVLFREKMMKARVLIDPCSQIDLVSEFFVKKYHLIIRATSSTISSATLSDFHSSLPM